MSGLFRKEAVEHQKDKLLGDVLLFQPLSIKIISGVIISITLMILVLLFAGTYAKKETVKGYLVIDKGVAKVYAPQMGTISNVEVKEGDYVTQGQKLFTIHTEHNLENGKDVDSLLLAEYQKNIVDFQKRIETEQTLTKSEMVRLNAQLINLKQEQEQITGTVAIQAEKLAMAKDRVKTAEKLLKSGNLSDADHKKIYDDFLSTQQNYQELMRTKGNVESSLLKAKTELEQLPLQSRSRIAELEKAISDVKQRQLEVQGRGVFEVRSPVSGRVDALTAKPGQWQGNMQQSQQLMAIIPKDSQLEAEMFVPTRAIGFVNPGQTVKVRYDAFPYQRYGVYKGKIKTVSQHILHPNELGVPIEINEPVYRVVVTLDKQSIEAYGKEVPLRVGLLFEADIILENQSLIRWILDPLYSLRGRIA